MGPPGRRIIIADDHPIVADALALAVRSVAPAFAIDVAVDIAGAAALARANHDYRLVLLDLMLPDARGFSGFLRLQHLLGSVPIAIVSAHHRTELVEVARALGAAAYLSKAQPLDELASAIGHVLAGRSVFPPPDAAPSGAAAARTRIADLSGAQLRVLLALADGRLNKQIAGDLGVTEATVKAHLTAIFRKLGVNNRTQALLVMQPLLGEERETDVA